MAGPGDTAETSSSAVKRATLRQRFKNQLEEMGDKAEELSVRIKRSVRVTHRTVVRADKEARWEFQSELLGM